MPKRLQAWREGPPRPDTKDEGHRDSLAYAAKETRYLVRDSTAISALGV